MPTMFIAEPLPRGGEQAVLGKNGLGALPGHELFTKSRQVLLFVDNEE